MSKIASAHIPLQPRNLAINGSLDFWQERENNGGTVNTASIVGNYAADMIAVVSQGSTNKNYVFGRTTNVPTFAQSGFQSTWSTLHNVSTGIPSLSATDMIEPFQYRMEGNDYVKIHGGKKLTISFWVYATVPGVYSVSIRNNITTRSYVMPFTIIGANTFQFVTLPFVTDTAAAYNFDFQQAIIVSVGAIGGANFVTGSTGTWTSGNTPVAPGAVNWYATAGNTFQVAQFSIVEGHLGPGPTGFQRAADSYGEELILCQRYYEKSLVQGLSPGNASGAGAATILAGSNGESRVAVHFKTTKRLTTPAITIYSTATAVAGNVRNNTAGADVAASALNIGDSAYSISVGSAGNQWMTWHWVADARL